MELESFIEKIKASDFFHNSIDSFHQKHIESSKCLEEDFPHFIFYTLGVLAHDGLAQCQFCGGDVRVKKTFLEFLSLTHQTIASLFNVFYSVPLNTCQEIFKKFKVTVCSRKGLYGADINLIILNYIKFKKLEKLSYLGIMYIKENKLLYKSFIQSIIKTKTPYVGLVQSVNTIYQPEHWCAYFYCRITNVLYFYNSLALKSQINKLFLRCCQKYLKCKIEINMHKQQGSSNLCGIYSIYFIVKMTESQKNFQLFDSKIQLDTIMDSLQKYFIYSEYAFSSPFRNFLDLFSVRFLKNK